MGKTFNIPNRIIIVRKEIINYNYRTRESIPTNKYQGYVVLPGKEDSLNTALGWAGCEMYLKYDKYEYKNKENYIREYDNGTFTLSINYSAGRSSQSGKLSFWDCDITTEDGAQYLIGINSDLLCSLLLSNTFINGVCKEKVYLGRSVNRVGAFTTNMDEFIQANGLAKKEMMTDYVPGQVVYDKNEYSEKVYLGEMYQKYTVATDDKWHKHIVVFDKPKKVYLYGEFAYDYKHEGRHSTRVINKNEIDNCYISDKKVKYYKGEIIDKFITEPYNEYTRLINSSRDDRIDREKSSPGQYTDVRIKSYEYKAAASLLMFSPSPEKLEYTEDVDNIIRTDMICNNARYGNIGSMELNKQTVNVINEITFNKLVAKKKDRV